MSCRAAWVFALVLLAACRVSRRGCCPTRARAGRRPRPRRDPRIRAGSARAGRTRAGASASSAPGRRASIAIVRRLDPRASRPRRALRRAHVPHASAPRVRRLPRGARRLWSEDDFPRVLVGPAAPRPRSPTAGPRSSIPMHELDPDGLPFDRVVLRAAKPVGPGTLLVDQIALTAPESADPKPAGSPPAT